MSCKAHSKSLWRFSVLLISIWLGIPLLSVFAQPVASATANPYSESAARAAALSGVIYVDPATGDDANLGIDGSPYRTLQKALRVVQAGETVKLASGVYQEANQTVRAGTASAPIIIEPQDGAHPILDGKSNTLNAIRIVHSFYTVRNLEIRNTKKGVSIEGATGVVLENNAIHHVNYEGLRLRNSAQGNTIRNNTIWATGLLGNFNGEGIYIGTAPEHRYMNGGQPDISSHNIITGNEIYNAVEGIDIKEDSSFNTVSSNIIHDSRDPVSGGINVRADNNYFYDNVSYNNAGAGFRFGGDIAYSPDYGDNYRYCVNNVLRNNIARNNSGNGYKFMSGSQDADFSNTGAGNGGVPYYYGAGVEPFVIAPNDTGSSAVPRNLAASGLPQAPEPAAPTLAEVSTPTTRPEPVPLPRTKRGLTSGIIALAVVAAAPVSYLLRRRGGLAAP